MFFFFLFLINYPRICCVESMYYYHTIHTIHLLSTTTVSTHLCTVFLCLVQNVLIKSSDSYETKNNNIYQQQQRAKHTIHGQQV